MTDIEALNKAIAMIRTQMAEEQRRTHSKHPNSALERLIDRLTSLRTMLAAEQTRKEVLGK